MGVTKRDVTSLSKSGSAKLKGDVTLSEGSNIALTQSGNDISIAATGGGTGDVTGPASSTDNGIARFHSTTGKVIQNSGVLVNDNDTLNAVGLTIRNAADTANTSFTSTGFTGSRSITFPSASGELVLNSATQTLTNKTLTSPNVNEAVALTATATELNVLDGITATTAELNILDGVTSTAAELNILDGVTATASELNTLDGITASTAELNYTDGVTSAIQTQIDGKQPLDSDLTTIAGLTATSDNFMQAKAGAWASRTVAQVKSDLGLTGTNSGDQTSIVGITGTTAQFNTANTDGDFATLAGSETLTNKTIVAGNNTISGIANTNLTTTAGDLGGTWTTWTPSFTASSGTPTTVTLNKDRYMQIGKTVHCRLDFTVTNKGTAAGHLEFTLPVTALDTSNAGSGSEIAALGVAAEVWTKTTAKGAITLYNGTTAWVNTYRWIVSLTYEAA